MVQRDMLKSGAIRLSSEGSAFVYERLAPGVLLVTISGYDRGGFGTATLDELSAELARFEPLRLFVDTTAVEGVTSPVREAWTLWFQVNQRRLQRVSIRVESRFVEVAVSIAKLLSRTGELIQIHASAESFDKAIAKDVPGWTRPPAT